MTWKSCMVRMSYLMSSPFLKRQGKLSPFNCCVDLLMIQRGTFLDENALRTANSVMMTLGSIAILNFLGNLFAVMGSKNLFLTSTQITPSGGGLFTLSSLIKRTSSTHLQRILFTSVYTQNSLTNLPQSNKKVSRITKYLS
jgi:hypothetical protein